MPGFDITSYSVAHIAAQARTKQLAIKDAHDRLHIAVTERLEEMADVSGEAITAKFKEDLSSWLGTVQGVNATFAPREMASEVGYPIKFNKTAVQLEIVKNWVDSRDDLISDLNGYVLHNGLSNDVPAGELPMLQAPNGNAYWGNENSSMSTVLLYSAAHSLEARVDSQKLAGAATFYPFFNADYKIEGIVSNPFVSENGMPLFGEFQFGGHRYFSNEHPGRGQFLFSPEDASSAVAKATGLTEKQVVGVWTGAFKEAYQSSGHEYGYRAVTSSDGEGFDFDKIEPGDILLRGGMVSIVADATDPNNLQLLEFNRDIELATANKMLGGGIRHFNLNEFNSTGTHVYVLRSAQAPLGEGSSLADFIARIDAAYYEGGYAESGVDVPGDCSIFFDAPAAQQQEVDVAGAADAAADDA
jgi:hypothetical protein